MSKRPLQASIAPDFLFKGRIDVHDTKSFLLAFIAPDFSENFLNKLETFSMRARHITGLAHNAKAWHQLRKLQLPNGKLLSCAIDKPNNTGFSEFLIFS